MSTRDRHGDDAPDATLGRGVGARGERPPAAPAEVTTAYGIDGLTATHEGALDDASPPAPPSLAPRAPQATLPVLAPRDEQATLPVLAPRDAHVPALAPRDEQRTLPVLAPRDDQMTLPLAPPPRAPHALPAVQPQPRLGTLPYAPDVGPRSPPLHQTLLAAPPSRPPLPPVHERTVDVTLPVAPRASAAHPVLPAPPAPARPPRDAGTSTLRWVALAVLAGVVFMLAFALARRPAATRLRTDPRAITPGP